jgi:hypothetical protein
MIAATVGGELLLPADLRDNQEQVTALALVLPAVQAIRHVVKVAGASTNATCK